MGLTKHHSLRVAERVLSHLEGWLEEFEQEGKDAGIISAYANGREQGIYIQSSPHQRGFKDWRCVAFAEHRNSDNVVIYFGKVDDFAFAGHVPNEDRYQAARHYESELDAAHAIALFLWGNLDEVPSSEELNERAYP